MALQGTLDTFTLPDVLRLLATTGKTGCLHVEGDRGRGSVWLDSGAVVAAAAERALDAAPIDEVVFEMLRFGRGSFSFAIDEAAPEENQQPKEIESTLRRATQLLDEWRELEAVVPSLSHRVALAPELTVEQVTIDAPRWQALVAIASGRSIGELAEALKQGELAVSRTVSDLVELGVAVVEPPGANRPPAAGSRRNATDTITRSSGGEAPRRTAKSSNGLDGPRREPAVSATATDNGLSGNGLSGWLSDEPKPPVDTAPKPRSAKTSTSRPPRTPRRTAPTPTTVIQGPATTSVPTRNGNGNGGQPLTSSTLAPPVLPAPVVPPPMAPPTMPTPMLPSSLDRPRSSLPPRGPDTPPRRPERPGAGRTVAEGPMLPPSLDMGRLGPSPLPADTGQIPAVSAAALPPDLTWAAEDHDMSSLAPPPSPLPSTLRTAPPQRLLTPPQGRPAVNGRHDSGETAPHVGAMSPDARAAVEATIGRAGGGSGGQPLAGSTQEHMLSRGQLMHFLSSVRPAH